MLNNAVIVRCKACRTLNRIPSDKLENHPVCGQCKVPLVFPNEPINVTAASYDQQVQDWPETVLAEFWARWCGHCRSIEPFVNSLAARKRGRLKVIRIDIDSEPALSARFTIRATPTFILYRNGRQIGRLDGAPAQSTELEYWIDKTVSEDSLQRK
jgi:thioredoxin 2